MSTQRAEIAFGQMSDFLVRAIAPEATRSMRQAILRPHQTIEKLAEYEPADAFAAGAFEGEELVAVGLIGPDGEPAAWRIRGMATVAAPEPPCSRR